MAEVLSVQSVVAINPLFFLHHYREHLSIAIMPIANYNQQANLIQIGY